MSAGRLACASSSRTPVRRSKPLQTLSRRPTPPVHRHGRTAPLGGQARIALAALPPPHPALHFADLPRLTEWIVNFCLRRNPAPSLSYALFYLHKRGAGMALGAKNP